jgi:hypothetical protein
LFTSLKRLDNQLDGGIAALPSPIGERLKAVQSSIRVAEPAVEGSTSFVDMWPRVYKQVNAGYDAYGDATNRLGVICGGL